MAPTRLSAGALNRVLRHLGFPPVTRADLASLLGPHERVARIRRGRPAKTWRVGGRFAAVSLLGAALLTACAATTTTTRPSTGASSGRERRPRPLATWQRRHLQAGAAEERGARAAQGFLPVTIYRPGGRRPVSLRRAAPRVRGPVSRGHVEDVGRAVGRAVPSPWDRHGGGRQLHAAWRRPGVHPERRRLGRASGGRRVQRPRAGWRSSRTSMPRASRVMGMSNGGRTVLAALRATLKHPHPFMAGVALYPGCQTDVGSTFYAPLLVLIGSADIVTPAHFCEADEARPTRVRAPLELVIFPRGPAHVRHAPPRPFGPGHEARLRSGSRCRRAPASDRTS